jgi:hypothetical protein
MIEARTLLRLADGTFVRLEGFQGRLPDPRYVEGAIELVADGIQILSVAEWDYVDQLWAYISDMISTLAKADVASTYFPDQPIMIQFLRSSSGRLLISCRVNDEIRRANVEEADFLSVLRSAGKYFFESMSELLPEKSASYDIAREALFS